VEALGGAGELALPRPCPSNPSTLSAFELGDQLSNALHDGLLNVTVVTFFAITLLWVIRVELFGPKVTHLKPA
jgi:hypothetical protein